MSLRRFLARLFRTRDAAAESVRWVEAPDLAGRLQRDPRPLVVDVRGADEFTGELGHIEEAQNVPVAELPGRLAELAPHRDHDIVLVCKTHMRSANAAVLLHDAGFGRVSVLRGGMMEWVRQRQPVAEKSSGTLPGTSR